ncbi:interleukin 15, like isoform X2 [Clupea harengus]|uniref:Interleukin 15, like isoform X2 n=1 Tax=Clupea harengus TaxID=7950 RepID=A0A6P8FLN3_CLUHA|nr:interleukin 15, like isoform X2 [Clupea harengus]
MRKNVCIYRVVSLHSIANATGKHSKADFLCLKPPAATALLIPLEKRYYLCAMLEIPRTEPHQCHLSSALLVLNVVTMVMRQTIGQCHGTAQVVHDVQRYVLAMLTWKGVDEMSEEVWMCSCCRALDCRLYTPTVDDYKICTLSTLNCFAEEVKVLDMEIEDRTLRVVFALRKRLKKLTLNINEKLKNKTQIQCPPCEIHTEQAAAVFLEALNSVLQYQCSADPMDT